MKHRPDSLQQRIIRTTVDWSSASLPLAEFLAGRFTYRSFDQWCERITSGEITLNGKSVSPETVLQLHDRIEYRPGDITEPAADLNYRIVYENDTLLVIDKPGNLCMHPAGPFFKHTLWHMLCSRYGEIHFINRLDRETSGLLLAAKESATAGKFAKLANVTAKNYLVAVHGEFPEHLEADGFLASAGSIVRKKRIFSFDRPDVPGVENAVTGFTLVQQHNGLSLVKAKLSTGRMHQIRATMHSLGFPVVGDKLYGLDENFYLKQRNDSLTDADRRTLILKRQALHSCELRFTDPDSGTEHCFASPLPEDMAALGFSLKNTL